jgi:hypothetical protein
MKSDMIPKMNDMMIAQKQIKEDQIRMLELIQNNTDQSKDSMKQLQTILEVG